VAINYPTSLDNFTNPTGDDSLNSVTVPHATQHSDLNDAVEALQAKVGVDSSAVTSSLDYKVAQLEAAATGKILQVVSTTKTDAFSASMATGAETAITGLSATITPTSASSTIHVVAHITVGARTGLALALYRGATKICLGDTGLTDRAAAALTADASNPTVYSTLPVTYKDSPSTTSATTYSLYLLNLYGGTTTHYVNGLSPSWARSVTGTSTITVMEVSA